MFNRQRETDRIAQWNALTAIINGAVAPVLNEQQKLDTKLQRVVEDHVTKAELAELRTDLKEAQANTYSREAIDEKLRLRDERIGRLQAVGSLVAGLAGVLWAVLASAQILHIIP